MCFNRILSMLVMATVSALSFATVVHTDKLGKRYQMPAHYRAKPGARVSKSYPLRKNGKQQLALASFSGLNVVGLVNITLHGRVRRSGGLVSARSDLVADKVWPKGMPARRVLWVKAGTLYIDNVGATTPLNITLNMPRLDSLWVKGQVQVVGDHIRSHGLMVKDDSSRDVILDGMIRVNRIDMHSSGNLYLRWIDSGVLIVYSDGRGQIHLAGIAGEMRARLYGQARLQAQYLRANNIMIHTGDQASADLFPVDALEAFAYDFSNVYLYHAPKSLNRMTEESGNIFQADFRL